MQYLNLLSLILNYFMKAKLNSLMIFHCWNKQTLNHFSVLSSDFPIYSQFASLNDSAALVNFGFRYMRYDRPQIGVFMDFNCNGTNLVINESSHQVLFNYRYNWLVYDESADFLRFNDSIKHVNFSVDTQLTYVMPKQPPNDAKNFETNSTRYVTFDVHSNGRFLGGALNVTKNYEIECQRTGCRIRKYLTNLYQGTLYRHREGLRDVTIRVAVVDAGYDPKATEQETINHLLQDKDAHIDPFAKFGMKIFLILKDSLYTNVSYTFFNSWSEAETKGGTIGAMIEDRADMISAPFIHTTGRFRYVSAIAQTGVSRTICMFRTPRNSGIQGRVFLDPFSTKVWILFGLILLLSAVFLWVIFLVEFRQMKTFLEFVPSLLTTCLISFGSACAQGSSLVPGSFSGRLAFICVTLISFIMYNYYTSIVVSSLLGSPVKSKIKNLADLADSNLDVGLQPLTYTRTYLNFSTQPVVRNFFKRKVEANKDPWYSLQDGINKMRSKPGFVYIFEAQSGYYIIENEYEPYEICDLNELSFRGDTLLSQHLHKNSSYKEILRLKMMRMFESGVYSKYSRWYARTGVDCLANNIVLSVGMEYAAPLFLLLLFGYLLVLLILGIEIICHRFANHTDGGVEALKKKPLAN